MKIAPTKNMVRAVLCSAFLFAGTLPLHATLVDLTTAGALNDNVGASIGGPFAVHQINPQSTGTGVIDSFVRIQANGVEMGFNTDIGTPYDTKAGSFTHSLHLSDIPVVTIGGVGYRQFLLDVNQNTGGSNEFLSLNQIQIFQSGVDLGSVSNNVTPATATTPPLISFVGANEVFRMNNAADPFTEIRLNYALNAGSGSGDMFLYVLNSSFANTPTSFVTLFSQFGTPPGPFNSNDGFEEWAVLRAPSSTTSVPDGGNTLIYAGLGLILIAWVRRGV